MATYFLSISCVLYRRLRGPALPAAPWSLGRLGVPVNVAALVYAAWSFFWSFWPNGYEPTAQTMNYAVVLFSGVMVLSAVTYFVRARKVYEGPVAKVRLMSSME